MINKKIDAYYSLNSNENFVVIKQKLKLRKPYAVARVNCATVLFILLI